MNILEQYSGRINGTFSFFDRIIIRGHITRFFTANGMGSYASQCGVKLKDFSEYAQSITESLKTSIKEYADKLGRPIIYTPSAKESKETIASRVMSENPIDSGLICIISSVEECFSIQPVKNDIGHLELRRVKRKCLHYYFYFLDKRLGFMYIRLQSWFPFEMQIYINGREMMKSIFDKNHITYSMYDNSFSSISDIKKAQKLADKVADSAKNLCRQFDKLAETLNPYLKTMTKLNGEGYRWFVWQCEYATDIMFKSRKDLEDIYPSLVDHAFYDFSCTDVFTFMGRKLTNNYQGEAVTDYKKRPVGWRVKFKLNSNHIKFYDKSNCLRIETTINRPGDFKIFKEVNHRNGEKSKQWVSMGKALSNLYRYAEVGKECNKRLITALEGIVPVKSVIEKIESVTGKKTVNGKTVTGLNVWDKKVYAQFQIISDGRFIIHGFKNSDVRDLLFPEIEDEKKQSAKTSRLIRKLRDLHILKKVPRSSRYLLTKSGRQITGSLIHMREHMYPEAVERMKLA